MLARIRIKDKLSPGLPDVVVEWRAWQWRGAPDSQVGGSARHHSEQRRMRPENSDTQFSESFQNHLFLGKPAKLKHSSKATFLFSKPKLTKSANFISTFRRLACSVDDRSSLDNKCLSALLFCVNFNLSFFPKTLILFLYGSVRVGQIQSWSILARNFQNWPRLETRRSASRKHLTYASQIETFTHLLATEDSWSLILPSPSNIVSSVSLDNSTFTVDNGGIFRLSVAHSCTWKKEDTSWTTVKTVIGQIWCQDLGGGAPYLHLKNTRGRWHPCHGVWRGFDVNSPININQSWQRHWNKWQHRSVQQVWSAIRVRCDWEAPLRSTSLREGTSCLLETLPAAMGTPRSVVWGGGSAPTIMTMKKTGLRSVA